MALLLVVFNGENANAADWSVVPSVKQKSEFDSNLLYESQNPKSDFIFSLLSSADYNYTTDSGQLQGRLGWTAWHYLSHRNLDKIDQSYQINGNYQAIPRLKLTMNSAYIVDSSLSEEFAVSGLVMSRTPRQSILLAPGLTYALTERLLANLSYSFNTVTYQDPRFRNYKNHQVSLGLSHPLKNEKTVVNGNISGRENLYAGGDRTSTLTGNLGINHKITETWDANLAGGMNFSRQESSTRVLDTSAFPFFVTVKQQKQTQSNQGLFLALSSTKRWSRASLTGSFNRDLSPSGAGAEVERDAASLSFAYTFTERLSSTLQGSYSLSKTVSQTSNLKTAVSQISNQISYQMTEKLSLTQGYSFGYREDLAGGTNAKRHGVWAMLTYTYPIHYQK